MHGKIDSEIYHSKLDEYKRDQQNLTSEIKSYDINENDELVAAKEILEITKEAKEIFISSKLAEKQQLLGFFYSNLTLNVEKIELQLREPFKMFRGSKDPHIWWRRWESNPCP